MRREAKKSIKYYCKNINTAEYKKYKLEEDARGKNVHRKYIEEQKPQWKNRTDYYENAIITRSTIIDVLSNDGVKKLLKKLYSLPKKKFKVKTYYKKPTIINKYDYIHLQYSHSGYGKFAEIKLLDDKYVESINISWVQINSYFALLEYEFEFKVCLSEELYDNFIVDNIRKINSKDFIIWYYIDEKREKEIDCLLLNQMNGEFFSIILQHYITTFLYSEQGKISQLICIAYMTRKESIDIEKLYLGDLCVSYHNKEENYVIISEYEGLKHYLLAGNNRIPNFGICYYISNYGNDFYYRFFGEQELKLFEYEFSKFSTGRKKITYNKELKKLLNKMQSISEIECKKHSDFYVNFEKKWDFYISNDKMNLREFDSKSLINYKDIYKDNFSYLKLLSEMNYTKSSHINSLIATVVSIIATIISVIAILISA